MIRISPVSVSNAQIKPDWDSGMNELRILILFSILAISGISINEAFAVDSIWELKEQAVLGASPTNCSFTNSTTDLNVDIDTAGLSHCIVYKSFNKTDVLNEQLNVTWSGSFTGIAYFGRIQVLDGTYDRRDQGVGDFPTNVGSIGFTEGVTGLKGGGVLHGVLRTTPFTNQTDSITMTLVGSVLPNVTIAISIRDGSATNAIHTDLENVTISNRGIWEFDDGSFPVMNTTGNPSFDFGITDTSFTDLQDLIPPVLTLVGNSPETVVKDFFYIDAGATALDNIDGDITGNIVTVNPVDTSTVGTYIVTYNVMDNNGNPAPQITRTVDVVELGTGTGGGGSGFASPSLTGSGGIETSISKIEDVEPLTQPEPIAEPISEVDRAFSLFDTLNQFFEPRLPDEPTVVPESTPVQPDTAPEAIQESLVDRITSFFSGLFGFLFGVQYVYGLEVPIIQPDVNQTTAQVFMKEHNPVGTSNLAVANNAGGTGLFLTDNSGSGDGRTGYMFFPNLDANYTNGLEATIGWEGACLEASGGSMVGTLELWDGFYDGTNSTVFPDSSAVVHNGNGILQTIYTNVDACGGGQFGGLTRSGVLINSTDATFEDVTLVVVLASPSSATSDVGVTQVRILDYVDWSTAGTQLCNNGAVNQTKSSTGTDEWKCDSVFGGITIDPLALNATRTIPDPAPTGNTSQGSGHASGNPSGVGGVERSLSQLSDVQPLTQPTPVEPPSEVDRAFSLFDTLNQFFEPRLPDEPTVVPESTPVQPETAQESLVDRISSFFSGLFGFLYGVPQVYAEMNVTERYEDYEVTQIGNVTYNSKLGLPRHILDDQGDWVAEILTEDANGIELESAFMTYYFDKNSCDMQLFDVGRMNQTSVALIDPEKWNVLLAPNGTSSWVEIPQNSLACNVSVTNGTNNIIINSTKSDANGTITEIYDYEKYGGLKHTMYFTNNNPSWTNHKFAFQNELSDIPQSFMIRKTDSNNMITTDSYSMLQPANQPVEFEGTATVLSSDTSVTYLRDDFFMQYNTTAPEFNGTGTEVQITESFNLIHKISDTFSRHFAYHFDTAIDQLEKVTFTTVGGNSMYAIVDYTNVNQPLGIGETISIDPTLESFSTFDVQRLATAFPTSVQGCHSSNPDSSSLSTVFNVGYTGSLGSVPPTPEACRIPTINFDISSIPDDAVPSNMTLAVNNTAGSFTVSSINGFPVNQNSRWVLVTEDLTGLSKQSIFASLLDPSNSGNHDVNGTGDFFTGSYTTGFGIDTSIILAPHAIIDRFEDWIEGGNDFYQLANCPEFFSSRGCSLITAGGFSGTGGTSSGTFSKTGSFLDITYDVFTVASEPLNLTDTYSASPDTCTLDWDVPADNGGRVLTSYDIERSVNGGSFIFLTNTGVATPTDFDDTTIVANESYRYRVSAINAEGTGAFAESTSCGIPSVADPPTLQALGEEDSKIRLNWNTPNYDGGVDITGYFIEREVEGGGFQTLVADTASTSTTFLDGAVQADTFYTYRVSTINTEGTSSASNTQSFEIVVAGSGGGGGAGTGTEAPVADPDEVTEEDFAQALADALAQLEPQQLTVIETVVSQFFEFAVVDNTHDEVVLNSIFTDQRLGIRWSSGQDIVVVSAVPAPSPFLITFEQLPTIKQGSGAVVSTDFLVYNLQVPRQECGGEITMDCVQKVRYEVPVTVTAMIGNNTVVDTGNITVDLVDDLIDPILVLLLATFGIPLVAGLVQRARGKSGTPPLREVLRT